MRIIKKVRNSKGLTLIELLLVVSLLGVVSVVIYTTLSKGIMIWGRVQNEVCLENVNIFLERYSEDIRNSYAYSSIRFVGQKTLFECPTIVYTKEFEVKTISQVSYTYDAGNKTLTRAFKDISMLYRGKDGKISFELENIEAASFEYYKYDTETNNYVWMKRWSEEKMPLAVRLKFIINDGTKKIRYAKTVSILSGG